MPSWTAMKTMAASKVFRWHRLAARRSAGPSPRVKRRAQKERAASSPTRQRASPSPMVVVLSLRSEPRAAQNRPAAAMEGPRSPPAAMRAARQALLGNLESVSPEASQAMVTLSKCPPTRMAVSPWPSSWKRVEKRIRTRPKSITTGISAAIIRANEMPTIRANR